MGSNDRAVERLDQIRITIKNLTKEALQIVQKSGADSSVVEGAKGYWYAHILGALDKDNEFCGGSMITLEDTTKAVDEEEIADEEDAEAEENPIDDEEEEEEEEDDEDCDDEEDAAVDPEPAKQFIQDGFKVLEQAGYVCKHNFGDCQSCGRSAMYSLLEKQEIKTDDAKFVFYHEQDTDAYEKTGKLFLAWGGNGTEIVELLRKAGYTVEWDGKDGTRPCVTKQ